MEASGRVWRTLTRTASDRMPVVLCIDLEPDLRTLPRDRPPDWLGAERTFERLPELRARLEAATGRAAAFTWFLRMDPQVALTCGSAGWVAEQYGDRLVRLADEGDELGIHTHTWRWDERSEEWWAEFADPAWQDHCLGMGLDAFRGAFGRAPAAHRGGDRFLSGGMLAGLEEAGVTTDLTVETGAAPVAQLGEGERAHGALPDYRRIPRAPYRSSPGSFPLPDRAPTGPLLIPLFAAPGRWPPLRRTTLWLGAREAIFMPSVAAAMLRPVPVMAFAIRSSFALSPTWELASRNLAYLAGLRGATFTTATEAAGIAERGFDQPASSPPPSSAGSALGPSG